MEDTAPQDGLTLWIAPVVSIRFPSDENSQREKGERSAAERLNERTVFSVETLRWTWNVPFERDNILVEVLYEENEWYIQPHARVLEKVKVKGKSEVFYIYVERQEGAVPMAWDAFREMCSRADLTLEPDPKDMDPVCVTKSHQKIRVLDLTAPKGP